MRRRLAVLAFLSLLAGSSGRTQTFPASRTAIETPINGPTALALDRKGHLYVIEMEASRVLQIDLGGGIISVIAGTHETAECAHKDGISALKACLQYPQSLAIDSSNNLYIGELAGYVRKIDLGTGLITTVAGNGIGGEMKDGVSALSAHLGDIDGIALDSRDNLFIADKEHERILKVDAETGQATRFAGNGSRGFDGDGHPALEAKFSFGSTLSIDSDDNLLVGDFENCRIRKIDHATTVVATVAISGSTAECATNNLRPGPFPSDPVADSAGNIYFVEGAMDVVRRVSAQTHQVTTVAGTGTRGFAGDGGPAVKALLNNPSGLTVDSEGNLYIAEFENNRIRRVDAATGVIKTIAGNGQPGHHPTVD